MKKLLLLLFISSLLKAQIIVNTVPFTYNQNFGTVDITGWTDNTTISGGGFLGWYNRTSSGVQSHQNITTVAPSNNGGFYSYECNGNNDQKIGSRASGGSGFVEYAVRFSNTSGITINSYVLDFDWYQMSLAGNGNVANTISIGTRISGSAITALNTGVYGIIGSFTLPYDTSSTSSGAQFKGLPCNKSGHFSICVDDVISNGKEIMIKWQDLNDANNDHHSAIDNVKVVFYSVSCSVALPIELISFDGFKYNDYNLLTWVSATELNNDYYRLEKSVDAINWETIYIADGAGTSNTPIHYQYKDYNYKSSEILYYRLSQSDLNGEIHIYNTVYVDRSTNKTNKKISRITNILGQEIMLDSETHGVFIYQYSDGSFEKKIIE